MVGPATADRVEHLATAVAADPVAVVGTIQRRVAADTTPVAVEAADTLPVAVVADTPPAAAVDILVVAAAIPAAVIAKKAWRRYVSEGAAT